MTDDELLEIARRFVAKWQPRLHLGDWRVLVEVGDIGDESRGAEVSIAWRQRAIVIRVPPDIVTRHREWISYYRSLADEELIEAAIVHELLHVCEEPCQRRLQDEVEWLAGDDGFVGARLREAHHDYREWWINHLARVLIEADRSGGWAGG